MNIKHPLTISLTVLSLAMLAAISAQQPGRRARTSTDNPVTPRQLKCAGAPGTPGCPVEGRQDADRPGYERGVLIVKLKSPLAESLISTLSKPGKADRGIALLPTSLRAFARKYRLYAIEPLFKPTLVSPAHFAQIKKQFPRRTLRGRHTRQSPRLDNIFKFLVDRQVDLERAAKELAADPNVLFSEPNRVVQPFYVPNDQYYNATDLWGLFKVQASTAWNTANGQGVLVAVVDTGVDMSHADLSSNIWINPGESGGGKETNGIDDDSNTFVDDVNGWDFGNDDNSPTDLSGHGTHVAGTIGAVGNNQHGVVGLAFQSKLMPVKGFGDNGSGFVSDLADAMLYAIDNGADVINNSWGGGDSQLTRNMVDSAHSMGLVVVSAAGNSNTEACNFSPANAETGVTVSAFMLSDTRSSFSNFGVKIDVGAPGGQGGSPPTLTTASDILSTVPLSSTLTSAGFPVLTGGDNYKYIPLAGTSMAAPHVSALAALLIQIHPTWTNEEIRQAIRQTADDVSTSGFDTDSGYGRINAATAVALTQTAPALPTALVREPVNCSLISNPIPITGLAQTAAGLGSYVVDVGAGDVPTSFVSLGSGSTPVNGTLATIDPLNLADGHHTIRVTTTDPFTAKTSEDRNLVSVDNVLISAPADYDMLTGSSYTVMGKAAGNLGFTNYKLEWAAGCNATSGFQLITTSSTQVTPIGQLGNWNLSSLPDGLLTLRLSATFTGNGGFVSEDQKCVIVDKLLAPGWPVAINHVPSFKSPKIADLDGDGTNEIVLGASVFEPNGAVRTGWNNFPGLGRTNPAILDIDGTPATLEVVAAVFDNMSVSPNSGAPVIYAYKHDKTVLWSYAVQDPNTTATTLNHGLPSSISAADVDGDGQSEIVFSMFFNNQTTPYKTWVFVLDAATGAVQASFSINGISWSSVALADMNNDSQSDLIIESWINGPDDGLISVVSGTGAPLQGWPVLIPNSADTAGFANIDPVLADIDGDNHLEVLVGRHLLNDDGTAKSSWPFSQPARSTGTMVPLTDGDCPMEVVSSASNMVVFYVAEHDAQLKYFKPITFGNVFFIMFGENSAQGNPVVADIDGDQAVEIIRPAEYGLLGDNKAVPLHGGESHWLFEPPSFPRFVVTGGPSGYSDIIRSTAAIGDVDGDGKVDLLVAAGGQISMWNLNQPFTPGLSYWPMFQHDLRNTGVTSSSHWQPDLYMQDTAADAGFEPNTVSPLLYISSDIWIRSAVDTSTGTNPGSNTVPYYTNEHQHENPSYIDASTPNYVYVKVRNRGCKPSTGAEKLRVYWADANTGLPGSPWPPTSAWTELDCVAGVGVNPCSLPVMTPGQDYVVELPWVPPDPVATGTDHYCLVARIETSPTSPFGMTFPESQSPWLWTNVGNNNNVVWKNVTVVLGSARSKVTVSNPFDRAMTFDLHFAVPLAELKDNLLLHGDILVDLGEELMTKWRRGGQKTQGFVIVGKTTIKITEPSNAALRGLLLAPREKRTIQVQMQIKPGDQSRPGRQFNWDLIQMTPATPSNKARPVGGERYTLIVPTKPR